MHKNGRTAFLISKPLQLMVSLLIIRQLKIDQKPVFIITQSFRGAREVASRLGNLYSDKIDATFFETPQAAFAHIAQYKVLNLFIDSDVGLRKFMTLANLKLRHPRMKISVFEEGLGTYSNDRYSGFKARIFPYFGIATHFGASLFTDKIFVLRPNEYSTKFPNNAKRAVKIDANMQDFLYDEHETLKALFDYSGIPKTSSEKKALCQVYLASWRMNGAFLQHFRTLAGDLFVKAHPHSDSDDIPEDIATIDPRAPAELAIAELLNNYDKIAVFDHNSSIRRYISSPRVTFQDAYDFE